jgi:hypothetical protein
MVRARRSTRPFAALDISRHRCHCLPALQDAAPVHLLPCTVEVRPQRGIAGAEASRLAFASANKRALVCALAASPAHGRRAGVHVLLPARHGCARTPRARAAGGRRVRVSR